MKRAVVVGLIGSLVAWATTSFAYEPGTHSQLSDAAAQLSVLVPQSGDNPWTILQDLNLQSYDGTFENLPTQKFSDIQSGQTVRVGPPGTADFKADGPLTIKNLIEAGAQLEDEGSRPLNHFFDPAHNVPLTLGRQIGFNAPDWALHRRCSTYSSTGAYDPGGDSDSWSNQCFSLQDAMAYYQNALINPDPNVRNSQFGDLFLTLGHVMHVLQDMAQPQHVRNDLHCDNAIICGPLYNPSLYEEKVYAQTQGFADFSGFVTYPVVLLPTAQAYWSGAGFGLADFANSNFVSAGTNFVTLAGSNLPLANPSYQSPVPNGTYTESIDAVYADIDQSAPPDLDAYCAGLQASLTCNVTLVESPVTDSTDDAPPCDTFVGILGSTAPFKPDTGCENAHASSYSIFTQDLVNINANSADAYTLNADNAQSAMNYLLPRAIGYSAGLINYFFRGRLDVNLDPQNPGDGSTSSSFLVTNLSPYGLSGGNLTVYYDGADGRRHNANAVVPSPFSLDPNCNPNPGCNISATISIHLPLTSAPAKPNEYMVVYNGTIGSETGIAAKYFKLNDDLSLLVDGYSSWANATRYFVGYDAVVTMDAQGFNKNTQPLQSAPDCAGVPAYLPESCWQQDYMAVYNKTQYVARSAWGVDLYGSVNGGNIIRYALLTPPGSLEHDPPVSYQNCFSGLHGIAINNTYLYVLVQRQSQSGAYGTPAPLCPFGSAGTYLDTFDHAGNFIGTTLLPNFPMVSGSVGSVGIAISANNSHICVVGSTTTVLNENGDFTRSQFVELTDPQGGGGIQLETGDGAMECASTSDRHYVLDSDPSTNNETLKAYDDSGALQASLALPLTGAYNHVTASGNTIYLTGQSSDNAGNITTIVYEFSRQFSGSTETLVPVTSFTLADGSGHNIAAPAISTDVFQAINLPAH